MIERICNSLEHSIRKFEGIKRREEEKLNCRKKRKKENPNSIFINGDLLEELFIWLPFKSLCRFKSVSKEWKSILESKSFVERHLNLQKSGRKSLVVSHVCKGCFSISLLPKLRLFGGGEEFVVLHYDGTRPSMSCDGLVCIPEAQWIYVLNPSTEQLWRFCYPPLLTPLPNPTLRNESWSTYFPGNFVMGFGRDNVSGFYKVVRIYNDPNYRHILDVNTGQWRKLWIPSRYKFGLGRKSAYVNGSIYWFGIMSGSIYTILSLDLHSEEIHEVSRPPLPYGIVLEAQLVNIQDRLAISMPVSHHVHKLDIWTMDPQEETWSKTHSICLSSLGIVESRSFTPVTLSLEGNVVFYDNKNTLFKYYPQTDQVQTLSEDICVLTPYLENLVSFQTRQVEFWIGITYIGRYLPERVKEFLIKGTEILIDLTSTDQAMTWLRKNKVLANVLIFSFLVLCPGFSVISHAHLIVLFNLCLSGYDHNWIKNWHMYIIDLVMTELMDIIDWIEGPWISMCDIISTKNK